MLGIAATIFIETCIQRIFLDKSMPSASDGQVWDNILSGRLLADHHHRRQQVITGFGGAESTTTTTANANLTAMQRHWHLRSFNQRDNGWLVQQLITT